MARSHFRSGKVVTPLLVAHDGDRDRGIVLLGADQHTFHHAFFLRAHLPGQRYSG